MKLADLLQDGDRLRNTLTVPVLLSSDHADACAVAQARVEAAEKQLARAEAAEARMLSKPQSAAANDELDAAQKELEDAYEAAREHLVDFKVRSIPSDEWEELVSEHPPTPEQREDLADMFGNPPDYNPRTFPEAAVALCLVEPEVDSIEDVRQLRGTVNDATWQQLWGAVLRVNRGKNAVPKSLTGSGTTPGSGSESELPSS